jgi:hypothetical protein
MSTVGDGQGGGSGNGNGHPARRWKPEDLRRRRPDDGTVSGRRFVIAGVIGVLAVWGAVYLGFRAWREQYRALAAYGATEVAPLVDPLADVVPPGVDPEAWRKAVAETHAMLLALTAAGLLERADMEGLRSEVAARVASSSPETVRCELILLWDDIEHKAGPAISPDVTPAAPGSRQATRHPRPARPDLLRLRPTR